MVLPPATAFQFVATHPVNLCFVAGMLLGCAILAGGSWKTPAALVAISICMACAMAGWFGPEMLARQLPDPAALLLGCVLLLTCRWQMPRVFRLPVSLGESSYALYLFHPMLAPAALLTAHRIVPQMTATFQIALAAGLAVAVAHLIHLIVERPLNRWASNMVGRRRPGRSNVRGVV